jgi:hypothetical protein
MGLVDRAKNDWQRFTSNPDEFGVSISIETPTHTNQTNIVGLATKHHIAIDPDGNLVNGKNAHVSFSEQLLTDVSYPVRVNNEVELLGHIVKWADSTGQIKQYVINEWYQDETVGMIVCILGDYE